MGFRPFPNMTQAVTVTASSATTALTSYANLSQGEVVSYEIQNAGVVQVACTFGGSAVSTTFPTATPGGYIVQPGQSKIVDVPQNLDALRPTSVAFIGASAGPTTVFITPGVTSWGG